jgi:fatty-acyl-CoA synthase
VAEEWLQLLTTSIGRSFEKVVRTFAERDALVFKGERLTYKQFGGRVDQFAKGLIKIGVKKGDHVAIWDTNNLEWLYAQFAAHKLGATVIPLSTRYRSSELEYVLRQADCSTLIFKDGFLGKIDTVSMINGIIPTLQDSEPGRCACDKLPKLKNVICLSHKKHPGMFSFRELMESGNSDNKSEALSQAMAATSSADIGYIMYTSGTTGTSKGAMIPCCNTLALCYQYNHFHTLTEESRVICAAPLHSNFGCNTSVLTALLCGACACILESWDTDQVLDLIQKERITHLIIVPSMAIMMLNHPNLADYDLTSIKVWASGGSPLPKELARDFMKKLKIDMLVHGYGLVEGTGIISTCSTHEAPIEVVATTVGKPWPYCRVKVVDPKTYDEVPDGEDGEIWSTDNWDPPCHVMSGYYKKPKETAEAIVDGWLRTGDMGVIKGGFIAITGRLKDMILVGGFNVFPAEIEDVIRTHPQVKDAAVIGVPDQRLQEVPVAFVQLKDGAKTSELDIIDFCRHRVSNLKVPRYVRFSNEFPLTPTGKVQKFKLKETAIQELNVGS